MNLTRKEFVELTQEKIKNAKFEFCVINHILEETLLNHNVPTFFYCICIVDHTGHGKYLHKLYINETEPKQKIDELKINYCQPGYSSLVKDIKLIKIVNDVQLNTILKEEKFYICKKITFKKDQAVLSTMKLTLVKTQLSQESVTKMLKSHTGDQSSGLAIHFMNHDFSLLPFIYRINEGDKVAQYDLINDESLYLADTYNMERWYESIFRSKVGKFGSEDQIPSILWYYIEVLKIIKEHTKDAGFLVSNFLTQILIQEKSLESLKSWCLRKKTFLRNGT
jgi:hypothetical protein